MQNKNNHYLLKKLIYILLTLCVVAAACIGVYAYSLMNNPDYITLGVSESYTLSTKTSDFIVRSYNADVITPSSGSTVKANGIGDAVVCVKYSYFDRDFYRFVVVDAPTQVTLDKTELVLGVAESYTLNAHSKTSSHSFDVSFSSSDEDVATVDANGEIKALKKGECIITASTYNGIKAQCALSVQSAPTQLTLSESSAVLGEGESFSLTPIFNSGEYSGSITYSSSDESVVTCDSQTITAKSTGSATVTVLTHNGISAQCHIQVRKMAQELDLLVLDKYDKDTVIRVLTDIPDDCGAYNIDVSVSDSSVLEIDKDNPFLIHPVGQGECVITATLSNGVSASKTVTVSDYNKSSMSFKILNQFPTLPTGCEVVSLTSVLNHYGEKVSMTTMADEYMPKKEYGYFSVSPHDYFYGTPYTWDGFGCFSGCIVKTAENYFKDKNIDDYIALDITGCEPAELYNYLNNSVPVITWVTSSFVTPTIDGRWTVDGERITWCNHEHCLVTTGYNSKDSTVTVADNSGGYSYTVSKAQFEKVFKGMGSMAVVILKK